jgi:hypothetical protein
VEARGEPEVGLGAVVLVAAGGEEDAVAGHGAGVVVAAFDLVPRVAAERVVAVVDGAGDGQPFLDHALPDHVAGDLIFEAVHALVEVAGE